MTEPIEILSQAFITGYAHALERGPKSMEEINLVHSMDESDYVEYLRGQKAGLEKIIHNTKGN
jgi:hypothetical protein